MTFKSLKVISYSTVQQITIPLMFQSILHHFRDISTYHLFMTWEHSVHK